MAGAWGFRGTWAGMVSRRLRASWWNRAGCWCSRQASTSRTWARRLWIGFVLGMAATTWTRDLPRCGRTYASRRHDDACMKTYSLGGESGLRELYMLYSTKCALLLLVLHSETFRSQTL